MNKSAKILFIFAIVFLLTSASLYFAKAEEIRSVVVPRKTVYTITVYASDNVQLSIVEFYINNKLVEKYVGTLDNGYYTHKWKVPAKRKSIHSVKIRVVDWVGLENFIYRTYIVE